MNLGIVADEFFCQQVGRMGGFGWAARQVATFFNSRRELGVHVTFFAVRPPSPGDPARIHDTPIVFCDPRVASRGSLAACQPDLLLTIDFRTRYRTILDMFERAPLLVWVRDPKPPEIQARVKSLRLLHDRSWPQGINAPDCRSLASLTAARLRHVCRCCSAPLHFRLPPP
jgi:hypothetical protein